LQSGYTKYSCFLCMWNSRDSNNHYSKKKWPPRENFTPGSHNVQHLPLVDPTKVLLPPLHIKLGLMKNFVKALAVEGAGLQYLRDKFPSISEAKLRAGIFIGPQIRAILSDSDFEMSLTQNERRAWVSFRLVVDNFLGSNKATSYKNMVNNLLKNYKRMGCRMSIKMHFLHSHLDFFPDNLGDVSDEHGERFHQDIATMEQRYQGRMNASMLGDYCWFLVRETNNQYNRQNKSLQYFTNTSDSHS
jgi:hypothetical protein